MEAAESGHVETVVALIEHGADVNIKDQVGHWSQHLIKCDSALALLVCNYSVNGLPLWWLLGVDMLRLWWH